MRGGLYEIFGRGEQIDMFIDINAYVGHWPFRKLKNNSLCELDKLAREYDITHMIVANLNGLFYKNAANANLELVDELKSYNGKTQFIPFAMVNPTYPGWERNARDMIKAGFKGFEISPLYHGYSVKPKLLFDGNAPVDFAGSVMKLAEELNVPVRICASFENFRGRSELDVQDNITADDLYTLIFPFESVSVFVTGFSFIAINGDLAELLKSRKNIYFDTTQTEMLVEKVWKSTLGKISEEQICFGSQSPFNYIDTNLVRVELCDGIDGEKVKENGFRAFEGERK